MLADGSALPYEQNVELVRARRRAGAGVTVPRSRRSSAASAATRTSPEAVAAGALTDPAQAPEFMARTGAACLAVSIGNVHGIYRDPPRLDWERLDAIRAAVAAPLSLHGASGIPDADVRRAIAAGVAKVNVNTDLREAYLAATEATIGSVLEGSRLSALHAAQTDAVAEIAGAKLRAFDTGGSR